MKFTIPVLSAVLALAGCASSPPLQFTSTHPASPEAPEGAPAEHQAALTADEATRESHALLSAAEKEREQSKPDANPQTKNDNN